MNLLKTDSSPRRQISLNFIEGTEFTPEEAEAIVFDGERPTDRPEDAHDIVGTYRIVSDRTEMSPMATSPEEFLDILRHRHAAIMEGRPERHPGSFKTKANRAGTTLLWRPILLRGRFAKAFSALPISTLRGNERCCRCSWYLRSIRLPMATAASPASR